MLKPHTIPIATYRLQMNHLFPFSEAEKLVDYWSQLGISHCYLSPITQARKGSLHGYDVVRFDQIHEELGGMEELEAFVERLHSFQMGLLLDIVPNHMCVSSSQNLWWYDVLAKGQQSDYAPFFSIEWDALYRSSKNKLLLPVLGKILHRAIEDGDIDIVYQKGRFFLTYYDRWFPLREQTQQRILDEVFAILEDKIPKLPIRNVVEVIERLYHESRDFRHVLDQVLERLNGMPGDVESFEEMKQILQKQRYRLSYWRMGHERINYRRFFDIYELAGLRQEHEAVFNETHALIFSLIRKKWIDGLRIDHIDGISDPEKYLRKLQEACSRAAGLVDGAGFYVVVEKILTGKELLPETWAAWGTTGYDFMNLLNGLYIEERHHQDFEELYRDLTGQQQGNREAVFRAKEIVLNTLFISELRFLVRDFSWIAEEKKIKPWEPDTLLAVLRVTLALMPVYRTYIRPDEREIHRDDRELLHDVIHLAKSMHRELPSEAFLFLERVLTLADPEELTETHKKFIRRFQQLSGPVMAKGVEDTAFYRRYPLASLNEVGAELGSFGISLTYFHEKMIERQKKYPFSLLATYTHDTKRSEDARARLHVLSEIPSVWRETIERWHRLNKGKKNNNVAPDPNEEYLIYQSIVATWPLDEMDDVMLEIYLQRIDLYLKKAIKEAKLHTSWVDPDDTHEKNVHLFIHQILDFHGSKRFVADLKRFVHSIQRAGLWNSLSQLLLKCTLPGIPDFYQGSELWDFRLVDPDNRFPVDYSSRKQALESVLKIENPTSLIERMETGEIKLYCMRKLLRLRQKYPDLFTVGEYIPIPASGERSECVIAFARKQGKAITLVLASRFFTKCMQDDAPAFGETTLSLPHQIDEGEYRDLLTGKRLFFSSDKRHVSLASILTSLPFSVLEKI